MGGWCGQWRRQQTGVWRSSGCAAPTCLIELEGQALIHFHEVAGAIGPLVPRAALEVRAQAQDGQLRGSRVHACRAKDQRSNGVRALAGWPWMLVGTAAGCAVYRQHSIRSKQVGGPLWQGQHATPRPMRPSPLGWAACQPLQPLPQPPGLEQWLHALQPVVALQLSSHISLPITPNMLSDAATTIWGCMAIWPSKGVPPQHHGPSPSAARTVPAGCTRAVRRCKVSSNCILINHSSKPAWRQDSKAFC